MVRENGDQVQLQPEFIFLFSFVAFFFSGRVESRTAFAAARVLEAGFEGEEVARRIVKDG